MDKKWYIPERRFFAEENAQARRDEQDHRRRKQEEVESALENDEPILDILTQDDRRGGDPLPLDRLFH